MAGKIRRCLKACRFYFFIIILCAAIGGVVAMFTTSVPKKTAAISGNPMEQVKRMSGDEKQKLFEKYKNFAK